VEQAVLGALAKLPADRPPSAAAFIEALDAGARGGSTGATPAARAARGRSRRTLWLAVGGNVALAAVAAAAWLRPAPTAPTTRQRVVLWKTSVPSMYMAGAQYISTQAAIAPDGSSIVFTDSGTNGRLLMRKKRESDVIEPLSGTERAVNPFFSPDGRWVGFATLDGKLRKVPVAGGTPVTLAEDLRVDYKVAAWLEDGAIVYTGVTNGVTFLPPASGTPRRLAFPEQWHGQLTSVSSLPGDRGFVGGICGGNCAFGSDVFVYDRKTDAFRIIVPRASAAWYTATGHLLYTVQDGGLFAVKFDLNTLEPTGEPIPVIDGVTSGSVALSKVGHLLYAVERGAAEQAELVWVDRSGRETPFDPSWRGRFEYPAIAPDGNRVAVSMREQTTDLWIRSADGSRRKVVSQGTASWRPSWSADSKSLTFVSLSPTDKQADNSMVMQVRADAAEQAVPILRHTSGIWEAEFTPDRRTLVFRTDEPKGSSNIYVHPMMGDTTTRPFAAGPQDELQISLSPDGQFLTYTTGVLGTQQVVVATFPDGRVRRTVSRAGGHEPRFSHTGKELFFENAGKLWVVKLSGGTEIVSSEPEPLFALTGYRRARNRPQYDVAPGDQRFLMIKDPPPPAVPPLVYVENWFPELLAKLRR
jgi:serine/threonine-protein kinase